MCKTPRVAVAKACRGNFPMLPDRSRPTSFRYDRLHKCVMWQGTFSLLNNMPLSPHQTRGVGAPASTNFQQSGMTGFFSELARQQQRHKRNRLILFADLVILFSTLAVLKPLISRWACRVKRTTYAGYFKWHQRSLKTFYYLGVRIGFENAAQYSNR